jgi:hypothetical protein
VPSKPLPPEALIDLSRRLAPLPPRSHERRLVMQETALLYGVSEQTLYRGLTMRTRPKGLRRADHGSPRVLPEQELERICELIAAIKVRTTNKKDHYLSTGEAIRLIESFGMETPDGLVKAPAGVLKKATVNRYLRQWGYDRTTLGRQPPCVRFQAEHSNECWQFDLSPSDIKEFEEPPSWVRADGKAPTPTLFSVVDDRSGVAYQEYRTVYGEDTVSALRFLFNAMAPKPSADIPLQGIPLMLYMDNGPVARSKTFQRVMQYLGVEVRTHMPKASDGRRVTARSKGKVERPFRTVKEMHETLCQFHKPRNDDEANAWLSNFLIRYNAMDHRSGAHSRAQDWVSYLPPDGIRSMCDWERFATFAREPERRKVGSDARVAIGGVQYEVDPDLAGEEVVLWWGLFDQELFVEHGAERFGPYGPINGPIPLDSYRSFKKTRTQARSERIDALAERIDLPRAALESRPELAGFTKPVALPAKPFADPDPFQEFYYPTPLAARLAIAGFLGVPLGRLPAEQLARIDTILGETLEKKAVLSRVRAYVNASKERGSHAE